MKMKVDKILIAFIIVFLLALTILFVSVEYHGEKSCQKDPLVYEARKYATPNRIVHGSLTVMEGLKKPLIINFNDKKRTIGP